jgi:hypothetical protein
MGIINIMHAYAEPILHNYLYISSVKFMGIVFPPI